MNGRIVIAGATGHLGRFLVPAFKARGWRVNAVVRSAPAARRAGIAPSDFFVGGIGDPEKLMPIMLGADAVFSAVGLTRQRDRLTYQHVDYGLNLSLLRAALAAGVPRFGYTHVLHAEDMPNSALARAKSKFVRVLESAAIEPVVIAPTGYFSDIEDVFRMARAGRVWLVGEGERRINPIHCADLAEICAEALEAGTPRLNIGGPETFTHAEIAGLAFDALGREPRIARIPRRLAGGLVGALKILGPQRMWGPAEFFLEASSMDMVGAAKGKRKLGAHFKALASGAADPASPRTAPRKPTPPAAEG